MQKDRLLENSFEVDGEYFPKLRVLAIVSWWKLNFKKYVSAV